MNYLPSKIEYPFGEEVILLEELPESLFQDPFFYIALNKHHEKQQNIKKKMVRLRNYEAYLAKQHVVEPTGFIFHPSRSGSTLVSQQLTKLKHCRVVSEPTLINQYIRVSLVEQKTEFNPNYFKALIRGFLVDEHQTIQHTFIKFTSWVVELLPILSDLFPSTPWVYLHRSPAEVITSNMANPSFLNHLPSHYPQLGTFLTGLPVDQLAAISTEKLLALLYAAAVQKVLDGMPSATGLVIDYENIKADFFTKLLPHFKLNPSEEEQQLMKERGNYYSKTNSKKVFQPDQQHKSKLLTPSIQQAIRESKLIALAQQLEGHIK